MLRRLRGIISRRLELTVRPQSHRPEFQSREGRYRLKDEMAGPSGWANDRLLELGVMDADEAITQLVAVLDTRELADAINRLEHGYWAADSEVTVASAARR